MPRPRPPFLHREISRHGRAQWYVRVSKGPRVRLTAEYGTAEFQAQYQDAIAGKLRPKENGPMAGTIAWAMAQYRTSTTWLALSMARRKQLEGVFRKIVDSVGNEPLARIDRKAIIAGRERRAKTPFAARHFVDAMRHLCRWALDNGHIRIDPTEGVKVAKPKTDGFEVWTSDEVERFEQRWPHGTRERVMFDVLRFTGLRRGDAARVGRQHVKDGVIRLTTEKTNTPVVIPILPELARTLEIGPCGDLALIATISGRPFTKESLGTVFRVACRAAGITDKSAHGLRKWAAARMATAGATIPEIEAAFGWSGGRMASFYSRSADRELLAKRGMDKLKNKS